MVALNSTSISHRTILSHQCKCIWPQPVGTQFVSILTFTTMEKFASRCSTPGTADRKRNGIHTHQVSFKSLCLSNHWFSFRSPTLTSLVMRDHVEPRQEIRIRVTMTSISDRPPSSGLCWSRFAIRLPVLNRFVLLVFLLFFYWRLSIRFSVRWLMLIFGSNVKKLKSSAKNGSPKWKNRWKMILTGQEPSQLVWLPWR